MEILVQKQNRIGCQFEGIFTLRHETKVGENPVCRVWQNSTRFSRVQSHFSPHFLFIFLIYLARALAILCKLGENYCCRSKLLGFRNGLDCYWNNPPYKKGTHIATDPAFQQSNQMLDAKLKDMKKHGEQNVKHKPAPLSVKTCSV